MGLVACSNGYLNTCNALLRLVTRVYGHSEANEIGDLHPWPSSTIYARFVHSPSSLTKVCRTCTWCKAHFLIYSMDNVVVLVILVVVYCCPLFLTIAHCPIKVDAMGKDFTCQISVITCTNTLGLILSWYINQPMHSICRKHHRFIVCVCVCVRRRERHKRRKTHLLRLKYDSTGMA